MNPGSSEWITEQCRKALALAAELAAQRFVIFDTETTGFDRSDEIVSIGVIDQHGKVILDTLIKPLQPIPNSERHGITDAMVERAPTFPQVYPQIARALEGKLVLAYNSAFDWRMLNQDCARHKLPLIAPLATECVMELYATFHGAWNDHYGSFTWQGLTKACITFGIPVEGEHQAAADSQMTLYVLRELAKRVQP